MRILNEDIGYVKFMLEGADKWKKIYFRHAFCLYCI